MKSNVVSKSGMNASVKIEVEFQIQAVNNGKVLII